MEAEGARIAMVHDAGPRAGRLERMRARFGERADLVVFGHSHLPLHEQADGRLPDLQPGQPDRAPSRADAHDGANPRGQRLSDVSSSASDTVYGIMTPGELIRETRLSTGSQPAAARAPRGHQPERDRAYRARRRGRHVEAAGVVAAGDGRRARAGQQARLARYDAWDLEEERTRPPELRLANGLALNKFSSRARPSRGVQPASCRLRSSTRSRFCVCSPSTASSRGGRRRRGQTHGYMRADAGSRPGSAARPREPEPAGGGPRRAGPAVAPATRPVDITDPQILKRAALVPLLTTYGRLDVLNIESTAGRLGGYSSLGSERSTWARHTFSRRRGPRRPDQDEKAAGRDRIGSTSGR